MSTPSNEIPTSPGPLNASPLPPTPTLPFLTRTKTSSIGSNPSEASGLRKELEDVERERRTAPEDKRKRTTEAKAAEVAAELRRSVQKLTEQLDFIIPFLIDTFANDVLPVKFQAADVKAVQKTLPPVLAKYAPGIEKYAEEIALAGALAPVAIGNIKYWLDQRKKRAAAPLPGVPTRAEVEQFVRDIINEHDTPSGPPAKSALPATAPRNETAPPTPST